MAGIPSAFRLLFDGHDTQEKVDLEFKNLERFLNEMFMVSNSAPTNDKGRVGGLMVYDDGTNRYLYAKTGGLGRSAVWRRVAIT